MKSVVVLAGDMLLPDLRYLPADAHVFMAEDVGLATRTRHHKQKIALFFSAMRHFAADLEASGRRVRYLKFDKSDRRTFSQKGVDFAKELGAVEVVTFEPNDPFLESELRIVAENAGLETTFIPSPSFLTSSQDWEDYRSSGGTLFMAKFYQWQRRRLGVLVEQTGARVGGKWSFDADNRKSLPKHYTAPPVPQFNADTITAEVTGLVKREFPDHPGDLETFHWPVTRQQALLALDAFLENRFEEFGPYEDAISKDHSVLNHSQLSPLINMGLLTPAEVIESALARHARNPVPLPSLEGFIRQIIGWREFIKGVDREYVSNGSEPEPNHFGFTRKLAPNWWAGTTGLPILDVPIRRILKTGWCHHIERLMIFGSAMLMLEVAPREAYNWFMEMFVDSADWVMRPNVYGMSQFADGGLFATKPYISGSAYLRKMSDYATGEWCEVWDAMFWTFVGRQRSLFESNPRMSVMVKQLDKMDPSRKAKLSQVFLVWQERLTVPA